MNLILKLIRAVFGTPRPQGVYCGELKTRDVAYPYRMPAGFPGDVNRTHPADILPVQILSSNPPTAYGQVVIRDVSGNGVRPLGVADAAPTLLTLFGVTVRPFPTQQQAATNYGAAPIGAVAPPTSGAIDMLASGLIMVQLNAASAAVLNGGAVYVWTAVTSGGHTQGGLEGASGGGSTILLPGCYFNGPADSGGVTELAFNL